MSKYEKGTDSMKIEYDFSEMYVDRAWLWGAASGDYSLLSAAFTWCETPQGEDYWLIQAIGEKELQVDVLKDMLEQYDEWVESKGDSNDDDSPDMVNSPSHYGKGSIECIDYIKDFLTEDEYIGYLRGNIAKYMHRFRYKNGKEDLLKAEWYLKQLIEVYE